jgi:hypothetical protein
LQAVTSHPTHAHNRVGEAAASIAALFSMYAQATLTLRFQLLLLRSCRDGPRASSTKSGVLWRPVLSTAPQFLLPPPCCTQPEHSHMLREQVLGAQEFQNSPRDMPFRTMCRGDKSGTVRESITAWSSHLCSPSSQTPGHAGCHDAHHAAHKKDTDHGDALRASPAGPGLSTCLALGRTARRASVCVIKTGTSCCAKP